jgi:transcriptional regulator GlxA family with amidase domain
MEQDHLSDPPLESKTNPHRIGFVLMPGFSLALLACAIEAFRLANDWSDTPPFVYTLFGLGKEVRTDDGLAVAVDELQSHASLDFVFLISSLNSAEFESQQLAGWLRRIARSGTVIAPLGAATVFVAKTGLLDGFRCTTHWRLHDQFAERFPRCRLVRDLYCFDRGRLTCAGGFSAMDLGLTLVSKLVKPTLAWEIAEFSMFSRIRSPSDHQRTAVRWRYGIDDERVAASLELMEENIAIPMKLSAIALHVGISVRQLERLFRKELNKLPHQAYLDARMRRAHELLSQSDEAATSIALQCGFSDAAHFTRACKSYFGDTPAAVRSKIRRGRKAQSRPQSAIAWD